MSIDVEKIHRDTLSDEVYRKVGEIHSRILLADNLLEDKQKIPVDRTVEFDLSSVSYTPFGEATIGDFTGYFLSNNVETLIDFMERLDALHPYLDRLKRDSKKLMESYNVSNYQELINQIKKFFLEHEDDINELLTILKYLEEIDELAPALFYTYPQSSSSQASDRHLSIKTKADAERLIERSADLVSGIYSRYGPTYYAVRSELESDYAESADPEQVQHVSVPANSILVRTSRKALVELATYFEKIRVCCEHIQSSISGLCDGSILSNVQFLEMFVQKAKDKVLSETTLWDFKQTFPVWNVSNIQNREKFALKVASYANNKGGILIAGITDDRKVIGVPDIEERDKQTRDLVDNYLENPTHGVDVATISLPNEDGVKVSCLLILIPQNCEPTSVTKRDGTVVYPYRAGVETKYKTLAEITVNKTEILNNNFRLARDLINFVYRNGVVG